MRIGRIFIENFRCFDSFATDLSGEPRLLIGENAIGKSTLISAIARALGKERAFHRNDFFDVSKAIDIRVTVGDLNSAQLATLHEAADFGTPKTLTVGALVTWDADAEECDITHGYPTKGWKRSKPTEREAIDVHWIPDSRDASRLLQFGTRHGVLAEVLSSIDLDAPIAKAISDIQKVCDEFAADKDLKLLLENAGKELVRLVPVGVASPYGVESAASTDLSVLRQLQLALQHTGPRLPLSSQSSGLAHLTLFAFTLLSAAQRPGSILLIDEPELSLHAHCQRALLRALRSLPNQSILSTHSAGLLDRADPRRVVRLYRDGPNIQQARPSSLSDSEAQNLARYMTADIAESFFAKKAVIVEGLSDKYAIEALALRKGKNLDAEGVSVVPMSGAGSIDTFLSLLGPKGLRVSLAGLCDASDDVKWSKALEAHGFGTALDRAAMAGIGFFVCDKDVEDVLVTAIGTQATLDIINVQGDAPHFNVFSKQPVHAAKSLHEQLCDFLHTRGRQIRYAPLLVDSLDLAAIPAPLEGIINEI